ncbi:hypothetical protein LEP1GSC074_0797 [Leptospira noguchii str. Hook]|nr:hypothetical protein LEP1GSC074_0797 [Leptospira noguchii str. Hook]
MIKQDDAFQKESITSLKVFCKICLGISVLNFLNGMNKKFRV